MRLLNFSIGQVQAVQIGSEVVRTAHIKSPVDEPWRITHDGAEGDKRAVHPDKIYAFARTAYDYWGEYLKVDPGKWPDGFFGENLTLDVLDEDDVRVGDVFTLGETVRLVVTGARTPCLKLAWRLNQPRTFQKIFAKSRRTGVYLGVLEPGVVRPGDRLQRVEQDPAMPSIADVCDMVADHNPPPLEPLKRLLGFEKLSPTLGLLLGSKLDAAERAATAVDGRWIGWRSFKIDRVVDETSEIRSLHLQPLDDTPLCQPRPGQFVTVRMAGEAGEAITRTWSLSAYARDLAYYRISVRRQSGPGSNWVHRARSGDVVALRAPAGAFTLDMGGFRPVVLIAAGIGVTPLLAMLQGHLTRPQAPPIYLIYGAPTPESVAFRSEIQALASHPAVTVHFVYSRSPAAAEPVSRVTADRVISLLGDLHVVVGGRRVDLPWYESDMYLCGPGDFSAELKAEFVTRGANADHIFSELFTALDPGSPTAGSAEVRFERSARTVAWSPQEDLTLLDLAEAAGLSMESDCRVGSCLTCKTKVLKGAVTSDLGDGTALLCIGRPCTPMVVLDC